MNKLFSSILSVTILSLSSNGFTYGKRPIVIEDFSPADMASLPEKINRSDVLSIQGHQYRLAFKITHESGMRYRNVFEIVGEDQSVVCSPKGNYQTIGDQIAIEYTLLNPHPLCARYVIPYKFKPEYPDEHTFFPEVINSGDVVKVRGVEYVLNGYSSLHKAFILQKRFMSAEEIVERCHTTINPHMTELCMSLKENYPNGDLNYIYSDKSRYTEAVEVLREELKSKMSVIIDPSEIIAMFDHKTAIHHQADSYYQALEMRRRLQFLGEDITEIDRQFQSVGLTTMDEDYRYLSTLKESKRYDVSLEKMNQKEKSITPKVEKEISPKKTVNSYTPTKENKTQATVTNTPNTDNHPIHIGNFNAIHGPDTLDPFDMQGFMVSGYDTHYVYSPVAETLVRHGFEVISSKGEGYLICSPDLNGQGIYTHDRMGKNKIDHWDNHPVCEKYFNHHQERVSVPVPDPSYDFTKDNYQTNDLTYYNKQWYIYHGVEELTGLKMWSTFPVVNSKETVLCNKKNIKHFLCQLNLQ